LPKKLSLSSQKYGFGIRDPGSEIRDPEKTYSGIRIPDPGVKKAPDPGSRIRIRNTGYGYYFVLQYQCPYPVTRYRETRCFYRYLLLLEKTVV
jgi:hypothetical protein